MADRSLDITTTAQVALSHIVLRTAHLDECIDFYGKLLGMKVNYRGAHGGAALANDGEHHRIALVGVPVADDKNPVAPGLEHVAYKLRTLGDLLGNYIRLRGIEINPFMAIHHGGTLSTYYLDPDGTQVELFIDVHTSDFAIESMNSDAFAANPIGVPIDMDDFATRYSTGESITSLLEQPELQPGALEELFNKVMAARSA
jgi:catechol-2,3-dioxygenase